MQKSQILFLLAWLITFSTFASHIRGGEITAVRRVGSSNTFDFTLNVYVDRNSGNSIPEDNLDLDFGDGTIGSAQKVIPETEIVALAPTNIRVYRFSHTYGAPGQYIVSHARQFRNGTVQNIGPSPDNVWFYVETQITISPSIDQPPNSSPVLLSFAVNQGGLGQVYLHNPVAYDVDGDSLSFEVIPSRTYVFGIGGSAIPAYAYPNIFAGGTDSAGTAPSSLTISATKGLLKWDVPNRIGEFNVAIQVNEWRFGRRIGYVVRDMQIIVKDNRNLRPIVHIPQDTCVLANSTIQDTITAKDPNRNDLVAITATGGLFTLNPLAVRGVITPPNTQSGNNQPVYQPNPARTLFRWSPGCLQVRAQPYEATFKAQDDPEIGTTLVDIKTWSIKVIGPPPVGLITTPGLGSIRLNWNTYTCSNILYFNIYRRIDSSDYRPDTCTVGVPAESGYQFIGFTNGLEYTFLDDNNGLGLRRSLRYCYRITAVFAGATSIESKQSAQACAELKLDVPLIANVSVQRTSETNGSIYVAWVRPRQIDTQRFPGPYRYVLKRSRVGTGNFVTVKSTSDLLDTTYFDEGINTDRIQYTYRLVFFFTDPLGGVFRDSADAADNILLSGTANTRTITLNWSANVPWDNSRYTHFIYKKRGANTLLYDVVGPNVYSYTDNGRPSIGTEDPLVFGQTYTYLVVTRGKYTRKDTPDTLVNLSYVLSIKLRDSIPPCPPDTVFISDQNLPCPTCEDIKNGARTNNLIIWRNPKNDSCAVDLKGYNIYFKPTLKASFEFLTFTRDTFLLHNNKGSLAGCYRVFLVDSSNNESSVVDSVCNDNCVSVTLPNIITPNRDVGSKNEFWHPICLTEAYVSEAKLVIYNRWGSQVYQSNNRDIRWPKGFEKDNDLLPGVYYYHLQLQTIRLDDGNPMQSFRGWIEVVK
jgi:gliding motility-associated-like protein